jgi:PAS domain S-box-containing protein
MYTSIYNFIVFDHFFHLAVILVLFIAVMVAWKLYGRLQMMTRHMVNDKMFCEIAERSFDTIFLTDMEGNFTYISPAAEKMFLSKSSHALGKNMVLFVKEPEKSKVAEFFAAILEKGHMERIEMRIPRGDGSYVDIEVNASVIMRNGQPIGVQGVARDVTERKKMEQKLLERNEELEKMNTMMIGREMKIIELKQEADELKKKLQKQREAVL